MFKEDKERYLKALYKPDLSKKGGVDERISPLVDEINDLENYVTTSSCSGRIVLLVVPESAKKYDFDWPIVSHKTINAEDVWKALQETVKEHEEKIWFKMESAILHVQCKTIDDAQRLITIAKEVGFKRSGIFVTKPERKIIELISTEQVETIVAKGGKILVDKDYIDVLIEESNKKLVRCHKKLEKFEEKIKSY